MAKLLLYEIRSKRGMSQMEVAERTGISHGYISEIENNLKSPSLDIICKLIKGLECELEDLIECD